MSMHPMSYYQERLAELRRGGERANKLIAILEARLTREGGRPATRAPVPERDPDRPWTPPSRPDGPYNHRVPPSDSWERR